MSIAWNLDIDKSISNYLLLNHFKHKDFHKLR